MNSTAFLYGKHRLLVGPMIPRSSSKTGQRFCPARRRGSYEKKGTIISWFSLIFYLRVRWRILWNCFFLLISPVAVESDFFYGLAVLQPCWAKVDQLAGAWTSLLSKMIQQELAAWDDLGISMQGKPAVSVMFREAWKPGDGRERLLYVLADTRFWWLDGMRLRWCFRHLKTSLSYTLQMICHTISGWNSNIWEKPVSVSSSHLSSMFFSIFRSAARCIQNSGIYPCSEAGTGREWWSMHWISKRCFVDQTSAWIIHMSLMGLTFYDD